MPMTPQRREKLVKLGRYAFAAVGGGMMLCFANFLQLVGLIAGDAFIVLALLFGILVGMMSSELPGAITAGFLAFFAGTLIFFGLVVLPVGGAISWELADVLILFAINSVVRVMVFSFLAVVLVGPIIGRIIGPEWQVIEVRKHELKVPLPEKQAS